MTLACFIVLGKDPVRKDRSVIRLIGSVKASEKSFRILTGIPNGPEDLDDLRGFISERISEVSEVLIKKDCLLVSFKYCGKSDSCFISFSSFFFAIEVK